MQVSEPRYRLQARTGGRDHDLAFRARSCPISIPEKDDKAMPFMRLNLIVTALTGLSLLGGCAVYGGADLLPIAVETQPANGFSFTRVDALPHEAGMRLHGRLCRDRPNILAPSELRWERRDADGRVLTAGEIPLSSRLPARERGCTPFDATLTWRPQPGEHVLVCAVHGPGNCATQAW